MPVAARSARGTASRGSPSGGTRMRRRVLAAAVAVCAAAGVVTGVAGCGIAEAGGTLLGVTLRAPMPLLNSSVPAGALQVGITEPLVISAVGGTLTTVTLAGK